MSDEFEQPQDRVELSEKEAIELMDESKKLLSNLYAVSERQPKRMITQDELRNDVSSFVSSQLQNLENQNVLKGLLEAEIAKRVMAHDMSNDELRAFYSMISSEKSRNIDSLFKLFAPSQGNPNSILTPASKDEQNETIELSSSQRQALEKLTRIIQVSNLKKDEEIIN